MLWMFKCRGIDSQNIVETLFVFLHFFFSNTEISSCKDIYGLVYVSLKLKLCYMVALFTGKMLMK